jgi:predicted DNA-binding transcriptional regulator AlpA
MNEKPRKIIRRKALKDFLPLGNTQLREHELHDPDFPKRVPLSASGRAVGYFEDEVAAYQTKLTQRRDERLAGSKAVA